MSFSASDSRIKLNASQEEHLKTLQPEEMKAYLRTVAESQQLVYRDAFDQNVIHENENPPEQPTQFTKRVLVDGKSLEFAGPTELDVERAIGDYFRGEQAARESGETTTRQAATTETESPEQIQNRVETELRFRRGELSVKEYIEQSGAVKEYLADQGVDMESLRQVSGQNFERSWASATEEFMQTPEGQTWEGGEENKNIIGKIIADADLVDEPSVDTLQRAVRFARENHMLVSNPELDRNRKIAEATTPEQIREALGARDATTIFGR